MRSRHSLSMRKQALDHILAHARNAGLSETILEAAEDAVDDLAWVYKRSKLIAEVKRLEEQKPGLCEALTAFPGSELRMPTREEIEAGKTKAGGYTRKQLEQWGVPWPPPAGWRRRLLREAENAGPSVLDCSAVDGKVVVKWRDNSVVIAVLEPHTAEAFEERLRDVITEAMATDGKK